MKAPGRDSMDGAELVERPHFSNLAFYMELFKRNPYQAAFQLQCHPSSKGNSVALGGWWFMGRVAAGRLLFVLQPVFINDQQPAVWGQKQTALCLILLTRSCLQPALGQQRATGQMKDLDHSELRTPVVRVRLLCLNCSRALSPLQSCFKPPNLIWLMLQFWEGEIVILAL